jgi:predicted anti-sigma-YlaC factor YlaD
MKPLLSCKEVSQLVSQGLDRRVGLVERVRLRLHLAICDGCSSFSKQMQFLRKALSRLAQQSKP